MANVISLDSDDSASNASYDSDLKALASLLPPEELRKKKRANNNEASAVVRKIDFRAALAEAESLSREDATDVRIGSSGMSGIDHSTGNPDKDGRTYLHEDHLGDDFEEELTAMARQEAQKLKPAGTRGELRGRGIEKVGDSKKAAQRAEEKAEKLRRKQEEKRRKEAEKRIEKENRAREREAKKKEKQRKKEEELAAKRKERVKAALVRHRQSGGEYRREISVVVSADFLETKMGEEVVSDLGRVFPEQLTFEYSKIEHSLLWRRKVQGATGIEKEEDCDHVVVCFTAEKFVQHLQERTLEKCVKEIQRASRGKRLEFVTVEVERYIKRNANQEAARVSNANIIGERAVYDCCTFLYLEYGVSSRHVRNNTELGAYICQVTDSIAFHPYRKPAGFLHANIRNRTKGNATDRLEGVVASSSTPTRAVGETVIERSNDLAVVYMNILCRVPGLSLDFAKAIRSHYPTLRSLLEAYDAQPRENDKQKLLANIQLNERRRVGPSVSKKVYMIFNSRDPNIPLDAD